VILPDFRGLPGAIRSRRDGTTIVELISSAPHVTVLPAGGHSLGAPRAEALPSGVLLFPITMHPSLPSLAPVQPGTPSGEFVRRIVIVETSRIFREAGPGTIATDGTGGLAANAGVQREPSTALAYEGYSKRSFGLSSLSSVLRLRHAKTPISSVPYCFINCISFSLFSCASQRSAALPRPVVSSVTVPFERTLCHGPYGLASSECGTSSSSCSGEYRRSSARPIQGWICQRSDM
jgi:hypothetical protein